MKRIEVLMAHFGNPQDSLRYIHIAGTNGKGSVSLKTAVALEKVGMKVGLFTSPHLTCFRERFVVNRQLMSEERCVELLEKVLGAVKENSFIVTTFEILFCISILHFKEEQVDYVVLECGIGGKWDTTNIIKTSAVSALTSVGLDHTELLGDTLEKIASDKADIAREGVPFICGRVVPHQVVQEIVEAKGGTFIKATPEEVGEDRFFMDDNHDVVRALLKALKERDGLAITDQIVEESLAVN
jgi:dihydrofolate synthase/folylpolyglutamate synthase